MSMTYHSLRISSPLGKDVALVSAFDAIRLCRDEGYERVPSSSAAGIDLLGAGEIESLRSFLQRSSRPLLFLSDRSDEDVRSLLRGMIATRQLVFVRKGGFEKEAASRSSEEQRRLVRAIEALVRGGRLSFRGRDFRLVADADLGKVRNRDSYEVASLREAQEVVSGLQTQNETVASPLAKLLEQAREHLSQDWRPPLQPDGLVLLRRLPIYASRPSNEPAITPSQLKKLAKDWIEIEVVDEDEVPYIGSYTLELPDKTSINGTFDAKGEYGNHAIDSGDCKLFVPAKSDDDEVSVTVVDETGKAIADVALVFTLGETRLPATTDGSGIAKCKIPTGAAAKVTFANANDLAAAMKPVWAKARKVERKDWVTADDSTTTVSVFGGAVVKVTLDSPADDASLPRLALETFAGLDVAAGTAATLSVQPLVIMVTMLGRHFDTDKCFLLPQALARVQDLVRLHQQYQATDILIVGHTDTSGANSYNLDLSLERCSAMRAYLTHDADNWLAWYGDGKPASKRWGENEDALMIGAVIEGSSFPTTVLGYQQWHNSATVKPDGYEVLDEDGAIGPKTRKQLVTDYMHRENTTVPEGTTLEIHGCGEYFPLDASGEAVDPGAEDGQDQPHDRRVEVFLFPQEIGIAPAVPGEKASRDEEEYLEWRRRAAEIESSPAPAANRVVSVILVSNSANVVLAHRPYELRIENGPVLTGKTDADGFLEHAGLPAGDHTLVVDGFESRVGATPASCTRRRHMMAGYVLVQGEDV